MSAPAAALLVMLLLALAVVLLSRRPRLGDLRLRSGPAARLRAGPGNPAGVGDPAILIDLAGAMLDAGASLPRILEVLSSIAAVPVATSFRSAAAALAIGADWDSAWAVAGGELPKTARVVRNALAFAATTGAPSSALLFAEATRIRREEQREAERLAAALGVKLVLPLGLCALPAFICLGVVPMLLTLVPAWRP